MREDDKIRLQHMLEAAQNAVSFAFDKARSDLDAYFDINLDILWNTIIEDLPPFIAELENILAS